MSQLEQLLKAKVPTPQAVKIALNMSVREFAEKHEVSETATSNVLNSSTPYPYHNVRDALAAELNITRERVDELLPLPAAN